MHQAAPNIEEIFFAALELEGPDARSSFLDKACGDPELRRRVERLLARDAQASGFLESPPAPPTLTVESSKLSEGPGTAIGPYKLMEQIGEGGMGIVYVAEQTHPVRRRVALKVIKPGMDSKQVIARFEAERQALAMMDHPNIAKVHDGGTSESGQPYFVMELVRGIPITDYCDCEQLPIRDRLDLFVLVCRAVQHAHQKGIIHRDLKPSNILVTLHDGVPVPKVIDFGVAKATGQSLTDKTIYTAFAQLVGTPLYMSPEQVEMSGLDIDTRSDIYSLGVLLYELLTGTTPFDSETLKKAAFDEMRRIIREDEPPKPSTRLSTLGETLTTTSVKRSSDPRHLNRSVRGELDWIAMKALEKDRQRRYETANDFAADVMRYLTDQPVEACSPSATYRLSKFVRRNRVAISTATVLATALAVGTGVSVWQAILARRAERNAVAAWAEESQQRNRAVDAEKLARSSEQEAHKAADRAKQSQADTQAFSDFLVNDVLAVARPEGVQGGLGVGVTVAQALETAEANLEKRFAGRPLAEATARLAIGTTWQNLTKFEQAERHLRRAVELREHELGPDDSATLESRDRLGVLLNYKGLAEAIVLHKELLKKRQATLGPDSADTLISMHHLALAYLAAGKLDLALPLLEQTLEKARQILGPDDPRTLISMQYVASAYLSEGRLDLALPLYQENLEKRKAKLGPTHPHTLFSMNGLAMTYQAMGKLDLALPLFEQAVAGMRTELGPGHHDTLACMGNLGMAYRDAGRLGEAIPLLEQTLQIRKEKLPPDHPDTLVSMHNLASAYHTAGKPDLALPLYERALELQKTNLGVNPADALVCMDNLAKCYGELGQPEKAEPLFLELARSWKEKTGADSPQYAEQLAWLARTQLVQKKFVEAEPLLRESLAIREKTQPDLFTTFNTVSMLGGSLLGQKKCAEAEALLLSGYEGLKQRQEKIPPQSKVLLTEALERLVQLYDAWGRKDKADEWRKKLTATRSANPAETNQD